MFGSVEGKAQAAIRERADLSDDYFTRGLIHVEDYTTQQNGT